MRPVWLSRWRRLVAALISLPLMSAGIAVAQTQKLTLKHAVELALVHSPATTQASADEEKALESYREIRNNYIPQVMIGSGLGNTWGYPLSLEGSAPSLVNITAQSPLFSPAFRDGIRAARLEYKATQFTTKDRRDQIVQDTTLTYLELAKWQGLVDHIRQQQDDATKMVQVAEQRVQAGIDNPKLFTQAKLAAKRAELNALQAEGSVQSLRTTLSQLTGVPAGSIEIDQDSVPGFPDLPNDPDLPTKTADSSPAVLFAEQHASAQLFRARAEHRALLPSVDFASQYAVLAKFNNWLQFFPTRAFERNNATVGVVIRFPFLNASQHAHAEAADADAVRAKADAQSTKNQVSAEVLKLQNTVRQLMAAKEVSELELELAKSNFDAVEIRLKSGSATVNDEATARADMSEKYNQLQDASFQLVRGQIALLRATGSLYSWLGIPK